MRQAGKFPKLLIMDLDGTALGGTLQPYSRFPDTLSRLLDRLGEHGCRWATNTTWDVKSQHQLLYASAVSSHPAYLIGGAGFQLCRLQEDQMVKVQPYSGRMEQKLEAVLHSQLYPLIKEVGAEFNSTSMSFNGYWFSWTAEAHEGERLMAFMAEKSRHYRELKIELIPEERRFYAHPACFKKGTALREIISLTDLLPEDIVVAGDERMDLDMMQPDLATHVICPDNAHPDVKQRVLDLHGTVGEASYGYGIVQAFHALAKARGWTL
jgi:hydroxymethylpyrimidine pyrophosphatase-like HAD family hydrolase